MLQRLRPTSIAFWSASFFLPILASSVVRADDVRGPTVMREERPEQMEFGVGIAAMLGGVTGITATYNTDIFHLEGLFGFSASEGPDAFNFGVEGWYHLHRSVHADFSLGGGLGYMHSTVTTTTYELDGDVITGSQGADTLVIELGAQIRAFVVSNVALSARGGLALLAVDGDGISLGGQLLGGVGLTYFFF